MVAEEGLKGQTIHASCYGNSGSKMSLKQFLLLRVLWTSEQANRILKTPEFQKWGFDKYLKQARELLATLPEWATYLSNCEMPETDLKARGFPSCGTFSLVSLYQINSKTIKLSTSDGTAKLDLTPIAKRTRSHTTRDKGRPTTPDSPTPLPRRGRDPVAENALGELEKEEMLSLEAELGDMSISTHSVMSFYISP